jgi:hypothetical protein
MQVSQVVKIDRVKLEKKSLSKLEQMTLQLF